MGNIIGGAIMGIFHCNVGMFLLIGVTSERRNVHIVSSELRNVHDDCSHVDESSAV